MEDSRINGVHEVQIGMRKHRRRVYPFLSFDVICPMPTGAHPLFFAGFPGRSLRRQERKRPYVRRPRAWRNLCLLIRLAEYNFLDYIDPESLNYRP